VDDASQRAARLRLAEGFLKTVRVGAQSSEHDVRNAYSRLYYSFFHLGHVVLGRYYNHDELPRRIRKTDPQLGQFVEGLRKLRIEADYIPDVVRKQYNGNVEAYRVKAEQVLLEARIQFDRMLKRCRRKGKLKKLK
jgi:hypothetical protein